MRNHLLNILRKALKLAFEPIRANWRFFLFMYLLGCICQWVEVPETKGAKMYDLTYQELFFDLYLLCALLMLIPRRVRPWVRNTICVLLYAVALVDVWCWVKFKSALTPTMLMLVGETNTREASEMLSAVLSIDVIFSSVGWILLLIVIHVVSGVLPHFERRLTRGNRTKYLLWKGRGANLLQRAIPWLGLACIVLFVYGAIVTFNNKKGIHALMSADTIGKVEYLLTRKEATLYEPAYRLVFSVRANVLAAQQIDKLLVAAGKVQVDSCSFRSPNIVLIIGESYSKHHCQLYGYSMPTTPRQVEREKTGRLVKFTDVVAPWNLTSYVFKNFFSLHVIGQEGEWCDYPLFPEVFHKAGYQVTFLTNQFLPKAKEAVFDFSGGFFLNDPQLSKMQFDTRNEKTYFFDEGLLSVYDNLWQLPEHVKMDKNLFIFHLMGQHVNYRVRFPRKQLHFQKEDYDELRPDLGKKEKLILSYYDNATLYNDSVVDQIVRRFENEDAIIIYMPDHGEEIYEGNRGFFCRNHSPEIDYDMAHYEYEIPFWIYCTHEYATKHPEIYQEVVRARKRRMMTDALPHLLLYLSGISTPDYHPEYNVLGDEYDESRPRLLQGKVDYDELRMRSEK